MVLMKNWRVSLKVIFLFVLVSSAITPANAQIVASTSDNEYGIIGGINYQLLHSSVFSPSYHQTYNLGAYYKRHCDGFALEIDALIGSRTQYNTTPPFGSGTQSADSRAVKDTMSYGEYKNTYIYFPAVVNVNLSKRWEAIVGLQYSYMINSTFQKGNYDKNKYNSDILKRGEASVVSGINYNVHHFNFGARYTLGLRNLNNNYLYSEHSAWHLYSLQLLVAYSFSYTK